MDQGIQWNMIDVIALIVVLIGVLQGLRRRLSGELAHLASVCVAFALSLAFCGPVSIWFQNNTRLSFQAARTVAFVGTIFVSLIAMVLVRSALNRIMKVVIEEEVDRIGGCLAGFVRSVIFVLIIFLIMNMVPNDYLNRQFGEASIIGRATLRTVPSLRERIEELELEEEFGRDHS